MNRRGFTLIELLVVIAIIGILAAIIFPVFSRAKDSAYRSSDITNMNALRTAIGLYKNDQGAYPPALFGYINSYDGSMPANVPPASSVRSYLYPRRVDSVETFRPSYDRAPNDKVVAAVWPTAPAPQRFRNFEPVQACENGVTTTPYFYETSGYDVAKVPVAGGGTRYELRYTQFWSDLSLTDDPCVPGPGGATDSPRQLGYTDPPEDTVVTWNSFFRDYESDRVTPTRSGKRDLVLFLGGGARPMDSRDVAERAWQVRP